MYILVSLQHQPKLHASPPQFKVAPPLNYNHGDLYPPTLLWTLNSPFRPLMQTRLLLVDQPGTHPPHLLQEGIAEYVYFALFYIISQKAVHIIYVASCVV